MTTDALMLLAGIVVGWIVFLSGLVFGYYLGLPKEEKKAKSLMK